MHEVASTLTQYIYVLTETDCSVWCCAQSGAEEFCYFLWICHLSSWTPVFRVLFQSRHPWLIMSRRVLPEFNSDLNWNRSPFHHILPSSTSHSTPLFSPSTSPTISLLHWLSPPRIIQHNENSAATQNSSLCAPRGMTTTAWDGDGGTGGRWKKRGETYLQQMG